jgi:hypothetical protein
MKRPSFQFYPADWRINSKLRRCSEAARGAWVDIMCVLHDADEYGICRWPLNELAQVAGVPLKLARELAAKDVLKGADNNAADYVFTPRHAGRDGQPVTLVTSNAGPLWYCSRFVRDEYIRQRRGQGTRFGDENAPPNNTPKTTPKPTIGDDLGDGPTSSSSSTLKTSTPNPADAGPAAKPGKKDSTPATALQTFLDDCQAKNERPLRNYAPLWGYAQGAGLPVDMVALAWAEFCRRFLPGGTQPAKRQKDWRATFRKYVENNYFKLWAIDRDGQYFLTSNGKQAEKFQETKEAA